MTIAAANFPGEIPATPASRTKYFEWRRRRQDRGNQHDHHAVALERRHRAFDAGGGEPFPDQRVAAFAAEKIHQQATGQRADRRGGDVDQHPVRAARHHPDHQQIGDLGKREERRIEEGDEIQSRRAHGERNRSGPVGDSAQRSVATGTRVISRCGINAVILEWKRRRVTSSSAAAAGRHERSGRRPAR